MTHHPIQVLPDGTRKYKSGHKYKPLAPAERKYGVNRPDHPDAVRFHGKWFLPLDVLPMSQRVMPETRPDTDAYEHMGRGGGRRSCRCKVCLRPEAQHWKKKWTRDFLRHGEFPDPVVTHLKGVRPQGAGTTG